MAVPSDLFGVAYLDAESFRATAKLFGVGVAFIEYPTGSAGDTKLAHVLQAASRSVDQFCGKVFTPANITEKCRLIQPQRQFVVQNPPVAEIVSCAIRYAKEGAITIPAENVYINNQQGYCEISQIDEATIAVYESLGSEIDGPIVEVVYKSLQSVPNPIKLATGYQAGYMINRGFVDTMVPSGLGAIDLGGMALNSRKGRKESEDEDNSFSPEAAKLLAPYRRLVAA